MDIGFVSAFVGGILALLSPVRSLLLPAFFASTVGAGTRLLLHGTVFYIGMLLVLVPLGIGAGALGSLFTAYRTQIVIGAAIILIVLGVAQFAGLGFDPAKLVPGGDAARTRTAQMSGMPKTFLLGATSGVAGCAPARSSAQCSLSQPLAATWWDPPSCSRSTGAGMVVPLLVVAALWHRLGGRGRGRCCACGAPILGMRLHTISMLTGALMVVVGIMFWTTNGLASIPSFVPPDLLAELQSSAFLTSAAADITAILVVAALILALWFARDRRNRRADASASQTEGADHRRIDSSPVDIRPFAKPARTRTGFRRRPAVVAVSVAAALTLTACTSHGVTEGQDPAEVEGLDRVPNASSEHLPAADTSDVRLPTQFDQLVTVEPTWDLPVQRGGDVFLSAEETDRALVYRAVDSTGTVLGPRSAPSPARASSSPRIRRAATSRCSPMRRPPTAACRSPRPAPTTSAAASRCGDRSRCPDPTPVRVSCSQPP